MLKYFEVVGLNDKTDVRIDFNRNLTILTGRNGSGKTTVLKLLWYLVSRNIERIPREMAFRSITLRGDNFGITVESAKKAGRYRFYWHVGSDFHDNEIVMEHIQDERPVVYKANVAIAEQNSTIFFPTFRRLEGGFSLATSRVRARQAIGDSWATTEQSNLNEVSRLLSSISSRLAAHPHIFVSTVSTLDVELLLTNRYASIAKQTNVLHDSLIKHIFNLVEQENDFKVGDNVADELGIALSQLESIKSVARNVSEAAKAALRPITTLSDLVGEVFKRGINITSNVVLGPQRDIVSASQLSAGEKQMLSFLCYNAFLTNGIIFIDEPELSLHVDWQRTLLPILLEQGNGNQFIVATHSPFIYAKYPECEVAIGESGDSNV